MDGPRFDHMTRAFTQSRRSLRGDGLVVVTGLIAGPAIEARKERNRTKRNGKPAHPNEYGCLALGKPCGGAHDSCSGICEGAQG